VAYDFAKRLLHVTYLHMTPRYFRTTRTNHRIAESVINMRRTAIHREVQYNNRFDTATAT